MVTKTFNRFLESVEYPSLEILKASLDRALNNPLKLQSQPCFEQGVGPRDLQRSLSKQSYSVIQLSGS